MYLNYIKLKLILKLYFLDEPQFVEWESDSDREDSSEYSEFEDSERAVEISDCASCASSSLTSEERASELPKVRMNCFKIFILFSTFVNHSLLVFCFLLVSQG